MHSQAKAPRVSVIIPTHNRSRILRQNLGALARQTFSLAQFEVVVAADGCVDDTVQMLTQTNWPFALSVVELPGSGPAAARNAAAKSARGELLIFMDDDIETDAGFVAAHVQAHFDASHQDTVMSVVIGYLSTVLPCQTGLFKYTLRDWWEGMFEILRDPAHRFAYTDLLSGNFSLPAKLFWRVGGFDTDFTCHEDYELGYRLLQAGAEFRFAPAAMGYHHEYTDLTRSLARKFQEGRADIQLGRRHPELKPVLPLTALYYYALWPSRMMRVLAFKAAPLGDFLAKTIQAGLVLFEKMHLRGLWNRGVDGLLGYWYWRGIEAEMGSFATLKTFLLPDESEPDDGFRIDVAAGVDQAARQMDRARPNSVAVYYGEQFVTRLKPQPGAEPLKGIHLRAALARRESVRLLRTLAQASAIDGPVDPRRVTDFCEQEIARQSRLEARRV